MAKTISLTVAILLLSFLSQITTPVTAAPDDVKWSRANLPTEGKLGDWMLASGSDVKHLTIGNDGTLYSYANPTGTSYTLFKTNDGYSWEYTDYDQAIVAIVVSAIDDAIIYVTDGSDVYKSNDGGDEWEDLGSPAGIAPITSLDVGHNDDEPYVFIGTADGAAGGGVYYLRDVFFGKGWTNLNVGSYDVYSIASSPDFANDFQTTAVITDNVRTYAAHNYGFPGEWAMVELLDSNGASFAITAASNISFPSDFDQVEVLFVGIVGGDGGVYHVEENNSRRLDIDADIISLDMVGDWGNLQFLAGDNDNAKVWYSADGGDSWDEADKAPSDSGPTYVAMDNDFTHNGKAYAATSGADSALSRTTDGGDTWNQISLIDTAITTILDLSISPDYSEDDTLFMLTWGGEHSLWRSVNDGARWERVFTSSLPDVGNLSMVELSPNYGNGSEVVFLSGVSNGDPSIWKSSDMGQSFGSPRDTPYSIDTWAIVDDTSLFIGSFDGADGLVYQTTNSGLSYSTPVEVGSQSLNSIALSPDHKQDNTLLVGNTSGWVYWSDDDGASFEPLPPDATSAPLTGSISITFDPQFSSNSTVYAASDTQGEGIYRFIIDSSTDWENIDSPTDATLEQVAVSAEGTLYATNSDVDGGIERSLNPTYSLGPSFETVTRGLDDGATLTKLWLHHDRLWAIDTANTKLMTFTDSLSPPITLTSPADKAPGIGIIVDSNVGNVGLDWETLSGATSYEWQLNNGTDFSNIPGEFEGETGASSTQLPELEPATTYYWRVRANEPVLSPWSDKWSFTTTLGTAAFTPQLLSPTAGATGMPLKPVFQWGATAGAESYELIVSTNPSFENPIVLKAGDYALPSTAWECDINLNYGTTYYWKVRAINSDTYSAWSAVSAFTTESPLLPVGSLAEQPPPPQPPPPPPSTPPQSTTPDWMKYTLGALLAAVVLLAVIIMVLVRGIKRL